MHKPCHCIMLADHQTSESAPEPTKPTKSAIKKAQKAARTERRLQQKVASKAKRAQEAISASASDVEAKPKVERAKNPPPLAAAMEAVPQIVTAEVCMQLNSK